MTGLALVAIFFLSAPGSEAVDADVELQVRRLVRQLDSLRLAERDAAEAALLEFGPAVLELLPPITDRTPDGVAQRLGRVRQKLEQTAAEAMAEASTITLPARKMRLSEVLAAIEAQSGNRMIDARAHFGHKVSDPELEVEFQEMPFWQALDSVLDLAGLTVYPYGDERAVYLVARLEGHAPRLGRAAYIGPMRIEPVVVRSERHLRRGGPALLQLATEIAWEPRVRPVTLVQPMTAVEAKDERGDAVVIDDSEAILEVPAEGDQVAANLTYSFRAPARGVEQIATLNGTLGALIPGKVAAFRFDRLLEADGARQRIGGATVTLEHVRRSGELWEVGIRVRFDDAGGALQSHRGWIFNNPAYLETPDGDRIDYARFDTTRQAANEVGMAYFFPLDEPPQELRFVYETAVVVLDVELPFELKDIPLP